jgi:1-hydroxycarotenoid 3,4-desaturase
MSHLKADARKIVVIGAGIAGLAVTLRLSAAGHRVTLLERHEHLGGKIRTTPSEAGPVDAGPTVLTMRHVFDDLFQAAGARLEDYVTLHQQSLLARHFWPDGSALDLFDDPHQSRDAVVGFAGSKSALEFDQFSERAKQLFEAFDAPMMQSAEPSLAKLVTHVMKSPKLALQMSPMSNLQSVLTSHFSDPRLAQLFGRYSTYVGGAPHLSPAILALIWHAEASGVWVLDGGMHRLSTAIVQLCEQFGADIETSAHVARIDVKDGETTGVELETGRYLQSDTVVFAGDPRALAVGAIGQDVAQAAPRVAQAKRSYSARVHSFAASVDGPDLAHHNVFFADTPFAEFRDLEAGRIPDDPTLYLCAEDRGKPEGPSTVERFEMIANAPATHDLIEPKDLDTWHQRMMTRMTTFGVNFSPTPTKASITTPTQFARMFPESQGALYGQSPHGLMAAFARPTARTPVKGLYLCGGGTHPGAGVPMATLSARHAAEAIAQDLTLASTSHQTAMRGGMSMA